MKPRKIEPGDRFERLTVIEEIEKQQRPSGFSKVRVFRCQCDCGNETITTFGNTKSCGCLQREKAVETARQLGTKNAKHEPGFCIAYVQTCNRATRNNIEFRLTREDFKQLSEQNCFYCGDSPSMTVKWRRFKNRAGAYVFNGLDRVDSSIGYTVENCVPSCTRCNVAKRTHNQKEFFDWIKKVHAHLVLKGVIRA